jgi:hypothetical protein
MISKGCLVKYTDPPQHPHGDGTYCIPDPVMLVLSDTYTSIAGYQVVDVIDQQSGETATLCIRDLQTISIT